MVSRGPLVSAVSSSETTLFDTDMETIRKYEIQENFIEYLSSPGHSRGPSPYHAPSPTLGEGSTHLDTISTTSPTHPEFLDRPGSRDVLENGAVLRNRYQKLKFTSDRRRGEVNTLLSTVLQYETKHAAFDKWLDEAIARISGRGPLAMSHDQLKAGLDEATVSNSACIHIQHCCTVYLYCSLSPSIPLPLSPSLSPPPPSLPSFPEYATRRDST